MEIQTIILGFLMHRSMTGYEIRQRFGVSFSFFSGLSYGSIYPAIGKLEEEGLVTTETDVREKGPKRKVCTITEKGRQAFLDALTGPLPLNRYKNSFLSRLFFFAFLPPEKRLEMASGYRAHVEEGLETLKSFEPLIRERADRFQWLCFQSGLRFFRDLAENVAEIERELQVP